MRYRGIIAEWMSAARLREFTFCNLMTNMTFIAIKYLLSHINGNEVGNGCFMLSETTRFYLTYLFKGFGLIVAVLGISMIILHKVGKMGGIDKSRTNHLLILGIVNMIQSILFMTEV